MAFVHQMKQKLTFPNTKTRAVILSKQLRHHFKQKV